MAAVTYGVDHIPAVETAEPAVAPGPRKSWFARFMDAMMESRMQQARREIAMHMRMLPQGEACSTLGKPDKDPIGGW